MRPVIGVMPLFDEDRDSIWMLPGYLEGVRRAGGLPLILPLASEEGELAQIAEFCDGFLMTGGQDVEPRLYGQEKLPVCGQLCPLRDIMEQRILSMALEMDKPVLGICRGAQLLNSLLGGTLYQDLPEQLGSVITHSKTPSFQDPRHFVEILPGTPLADMLGQGKMEVNTLHHQGICRLAPGLEEAARAEDGLTEAVWLPGKRFIMAVQWHPEMLFPGDARHLSLFRGLVSACDGEAAPKSDTLVIVPEAVEYYFDRNGVNAFCAMTESQSFSVSTLTYLEDDDPEGAPSVEWSALEGYENRAPEKIFFSKGCLRLDFGIHPFLDVYREVRLLVEVRKELVDFFVNALFLGEIVSYAEEFPAERRVEFTARRGFLEDAGDEEFV